MLSLPPDLVLTVSDVGKPGWDASICNWGTPHAFYEAAASIPTRECRGEHVGEISETDHDKWVRFVATLASLRFLQV